jgi:hypothetical protein
LAFATVAKAQEEGDWIYSFSLTGDSRYIFFGVDFAAKNDAAAATFGLTVTKGDFNAYGYAVSSSGYFEWGAMFDYTLYSGAVGFKTTLYPFGWKSDKAYWGLVVIEEMTISNRFAPISFAWSCTYVPAEEFKDLNGHYFYVGMTKEVLGFKLQAGANYNLHYFALGKGAGGIVGILKSIQIAPTATLDVYFKYFINASKVNTDEQVVGAILSVRL